jgi:hypothetical protein
VGAPTSSAFPPTGDTSSRLLTRRLASMHANGCNAILADEMGLGKTLQVCNHTHHSTCM